jgi:acyl-CoA synthetase (AMP-forming)/AMP-acid ligase II
VWVQMLHTSGSGGKKKKVPYTLEAFVVGLLLLARSRGLHERDGDADDAPCPVEALSMLPLFHNAGIFRNLAVLLVRLAPNPTTSLVVIALSVAVCVAAHDERSYHAECSGRRAMFGFARVGQVGGRLVLAGKLNPPLACQLLQQRRITYLVGSPTMLQTVLSAAVVMRLPKRLVRSHPRGGVRAQ